MLPKLLRSPLPWLAALSLACDTAHVVERGRWQYTCGDPVCHGYQPPAGVAACTGQKSGDTCPVLDERCDPRDPCNRLLVCETDPPPPNPCPVAALAVALALVTSGFAPAHADDDEPVPRVTLPAALARALGEDLPEVVWIGLHPKRNDGAWVLLGDGWTLVTGLPADARAEVKAARKLPSQAPPVPPPDVGASLHVVRFERP